MLIVAWHSSNGKILNDVEILATAMHMTPCMLEPARPRLDFAGRASCARLIFCIVDVFYTFKVGLFGVVHMIYALRDCLRPGSSDEPGGTVGARD